MTKFTKAIRLVAIALTLEAIVILPNSFANLFANRQNVQAQPEPNSVEISPAEKYQERSRPKPPPHLAFDKAAKKLGVTEDQLIEALGLPPKPPRPDFASAAKKLGVTEVKLVEALGLPPKPPEGDRHPRCMPSPSDRREN